MKSDSPSGSILVLLMKHKNTLEKGSVRTIIYQEGKSWFGVALEFNIVETGTSAKGVMAMLDEAINGYVTSARKAKLRPHVLNQIVDSEYESLWKKLEGKKTIPSPIKVHSFGEHSLSFA